MTPERDAEPGAAYTAAVSSDAREATPSRDDPAEEAVESNSSNYGGSAVADEPIEERVLHDD